MTMCCITCKRRNKVTEEGWQQVKSNVYCGLCQPRSLLFGTWEFTSEQNQAAFLEEMGGITETSRDKFVRKKQIVQLNPTRDENAWLYRVESETGDRIELSIRFGIEKHEITPYRVPAKATYLREGKNKMIVNYVMYDERRVKVTKEVKWWRPNKLIIKMVLNNLVSVRKYRRLDTV